MEKPTLEIDALVYHKIMHWVDKAGRDECSGIGKVVVTGNVIRVVSAMMLPQQNRASTTDIEPTDMATAMYALRETEGELRFWWHSHVTMGVFWSQTDKNTIRDFGAGGWMCATVFNQKREMRSAVYLKQPFEIMMDDLNTKIITTLDQTLIKGWDVEFEENVKKNTPTPLYSGYGWTGWGAGNGQHQPPSADEIAWRMETRIEGASSAFGMPAVPFHRSEGLPKYSYSWNGSWHKIEEGVWAYMTKFELDGFVAKLAAGEFPEIDLFEDEENLNLPALIPPTDVADEDAEAWVRAYSGMSEV